MFKIITNTRELYIDLENISTIDEVNCKITFVSDSGYSYISNIKNIKELLMQFKIK